MTTTDSSRLTAPETESLSGDSAVKTVDLVKKFKSTVVDRLSIAVPRGCICGFVGPNGAGKTTTLKMLLGIVPPTSGTARVLGVDPRRDGHEIRDRVGYVPDISHIYKWMSVSQVFEFASGLFRSWDEDFRRSFSKRLALPERQTIKQLSRGELAKVSLVIAMAHRPDLLILDEPTTSLDPLVRAEFLDAVCESAKASGTTVLFSTHILSDIDRIANRMIAVSKGKLIVDDSIETLRNRYTKVSFVFANRPAERLHLPQACHVAKGVREWVAVFPSNLAASLDVISREIGAISATVHSMTTEDLFREIFDPASQID